MSNFRLFAIGWCVSNGLNTFAMFFVEAKGGVFAWAAMAMSFGFAAVAIFGDHTKAQ